MKTTREILVDASEEVLTWIREQEAITRVMNPGRMFGSRLALFGLAKTKKRSTQRSNRALWIFMVVVCIWVCGPCDAQIEVEAYIPNFGSNNVSVINTATNTVVRSPIPAGSNPFALGPFVSPNIIVVAGGLIVVPFTTIPLPFWTPVMYLPVTWKLFFTE